MRYLFVLLPLCLLLVGCGDTPPIPTPVITNTATAIPATATAIPTPRETATLDIAATVQANKLATVAAINTERAAEGRTIHATETAAARGTDTPVPPTFTPGPPTATAPPYVSFSGNQSLDSNTFTLYSGFHTIVWAAENHSDYTCTFYALLEPATPAGAIGQIIADKLVGSAQRWTGHASFNINNLSNWFLRVISSCSWIIEVDP